MKPSITLILGTSRTNNESSKVAQFLKGMLEESGLAEVSYLDLGEAAFPILEERLDHMETPLPSLAFWNQKIQASQGILIVAPEYKNGYPGSLKNFLDYLPRAAFQYKPIGIATVSSGIIGGVNCLAQLRLVCLAMAGLPIPNHLRVPQVKSLFPADGSGPGEDFHTLASGFVSEYLKYVKACRHLATD